MPRKFVYVTPASGSNNGSFNVSCAKNTDAARSAVITVSGNEAYIVKTINVNQNMNYKVYPLVYYIFPFTVLENYSAVENGSFYNIETDAHITDDVEIMDVQVGLYNLKALKPDIDLAHSCTLKRVYINYGYSNSMQFDFDVVGTCLSNKFNGMAVATIPTEKQEEFKTAIQRVIDTKINYIMFNIIFNNTSIIYKINILPA